MKRKLVLFIFGLFILFVGITMAQRPYFCPRRCPLQGVFYCPAPHCIASSQTTQGVCCCNGSYQGENVCCWYRGVGRVCVGSAWWCGKYLQGYCEEYDKYEVGSCDRDANHELYCKP